MLKPGGPIATKEIADLAVTTQKIAASAVTTAKINATAVTAAKIGTSAVTATKIAGSAVTSAKINTSAVTTAKIASLNVTTGKIAASAITTAKINATAVTAAKIGTSAVTATKIAVSAVTSAKIASLNVTTGKINTSAVTAVKIQNSAAVWLKVHPVTAVAGGATYAAVQGRTYIAGTAANTTLTCFSVPASPSRGDKMWIVGRGGGGWRVKQRPLVHIRVGNTKSTTGTGGYVQSNDRYDCVEMQCRAGTGTTETTSETQGMMNPAFVTGAASGGARVWDNMTSMLTQNYYVSGGVSYGFAKATAAGGGDVVSYLVKMYDLGFSIPVGATVAGVEVLVVRKATRSNDADCVRDKVVKLLTTAGAPTGSNKADTATNWPSITFMTGKSYGGTSSTWGTALTPTWVNNSGFGVGLQVSICPSGGAVMTAMVDYMGIRITFSYAGTLWEATAYVGNLVVV